MRVSFETPWLTRNGTAARPLCPAATEKTRRHVVYKLYSRQEATLLSRSQLCVTCHHSFHRVNLVCRGFARLGLWHVNAREDRRQNPLHRLKCRRAVRQGQATLTLDSFGLVLRRRPFDSQGPSSCAVTDAKRQQTISQAHVFVSGIEHSKHSRFIDSHFVTPKAKPRNWRGEQIEWTSQSMTLL